MEFSSFDELTSYIKQLSEESFCTFCIRNCRSVENANKNLMATCPKTYHKKFKYSFVKYACKHFGERKSRSAGIRPNQRTYKCGCEAFIFASVDRKKDKLVIRKFNLNHNHQTSEDLFIKYPEQRRLSKEEAKVVKKLTRQKIPASLICKHMKENHGKHLNVKDIHNVRKKRPKVSVSETETFPEMATAISSGPHLVAVCQLMCTSDKAKNLKDVKALVKRGAKLGAKVIFLPEACDYIAETATQSFELAEPLNGPTVKAYQRLAAEQDVWLSMCVHIKNEENSEDNRLYNSHIVIDSTGNIIERYDKLHLFDVDVKGAFSLKESSWTVPGSKVIPPISSPIGNLGLSICYDLRFPELSLCLAQGGAHILTYPSAFMQTTGLAHWEALLKARAIETQCYVIAAAQSGKPNPARTFYGHSMVIDPWGQVIASCHEGKDVCLASIDLEYLIKVRTEMPIWDHRRSDLYKLLSFTTPDLD